MASSEELRALHEKIDQLERLVRTNSEDCVKMARHIDFVERVYNYLRSPLCYLTSAFGRRSQESELPRLESELPRLESELPLLTADRGVGGEHAIKEVESAGGG